VGELADEGDVQEIFPGAHEAAQEMLRGAGISDVRVVPTSGYLSDHYNPANKTLALSEATYASNSVAAVGVACHEAGHAIQHAQAYKPMWLRSILVPTASFGSSASYFVVLGGMLFHSANLVYLGAVLFAAVLLFQVVTLPVEFDATARAKRLAVDTGIVTAQERVGMDKVLNAAAMTYVAAVVSSLLTLLYYLLRASSMSRR
jgi:Zn-dependent membrane protease YugP